MNTGSAKKIIDGFIKLSKIDKNIEMLNSGYIIDFLKSNPKITNTEIEKYNILVTKASIRIRLSKSCIEDK
jgi:hypothetical protein